MLVLAPGAGADMHHPFMGYFADSLVSAGLKVCRFNFRYQELGRKSPDRQNVAEETYLAVVDELRALWDGPLLLGGKSMGGRIASHLAATGTPCEGIFLLGYPLHPPGRPERLRDEHLYAITAPMLFVEGTRDPFCPLETLEQVRRNLRNRHELRVIDGGDHSLRVTKSSGRTTEDAWTEAAAAVAEWSHSLI